MSGWDSGIRLIGLVTYIGEPGIEMAGQKALVPLRELKGQSSLEDFSGEPRNSIPEVFKGSSSLTLQYRGRSNHQSSLEDFSNELRNLFRSGSPAIPEQSQPLFRILERSRQRIGGQP